MPRIARQKSESGIYHIMLRGTNRQVIFHDDADNIRFLETLKRFKKVSKIEIYSWCLMGNHIHILLKEGKEELATTMKRIGVSYVAYYNLKYKLIGHLFQDRFKSENVENDSNFLSVLRYIHQNPLKAKLIKNIEDWEWNSYNTYLDDFQDELVDKDICIEMISNNKENFIREFIDFHNTDDENSHIEDTINFCLTDIEAIVEIKNKFNNLNIPRVKLLPKNERDEIIRVTKNIKGISHRQIARIFGISTNIVFKT